MSSRVVTRGIECIWILLLILSAQAINYEVYKRDDEVKMKPKNYTALTSRDDLLERLNLIAPKASYTLQEGTEYMLHFGAFLQALILDTFGNLLYMHYDEFSVEEVEALHTVYRETLERRYNIFDLVPGILEHPDAKPSRICADIYTHAKPCLKSSASACSKIRKRYDLLQPDDRDILSALNVTNLVYYSSRTLKRYPRGFSLPALLKLLQRGVLAITPGLLSGLLLNVRYNRLDSDVRHAESKLVRHFDAVVARTLIPLSSRELKRYRSVQSLLRRCISLQTGQFSDDRLRNQALLVVKHLSDDVGAIDENVHLLGNVYENGTIHIGYLFDLVLPDDVLSDDIVGAKRYLVEKLNEFDVVTRYLRVNKYQQATPAQLVMEIIGQLRDIGFAEDIATALWIHARFWRGSHMIEDLYELLTLFDAYENLRRVPSYRDMMTNVDKIKRSLSSMRNVPVEILCHAPRACLRTGLQTVLRCKFVSLEIKELIGDFLKRLTFRGALLNDECSIFISTVQETRRMTNVSNLKPPETNVFAATTEHSETKMETSTVSDLYETKTTKLEVTSRSSAIRKDDQSEASTTSSKKYKRKETAGSVEASNKVAQEFSAESELSLEDRTQFMNLMTIRTDEMHNETTAATSTLATTMESRQDETSAAAMSTAMATIIATTTNKEIPIVDINLELTRQNNVTSESHDEDFDTDATRTWENSTASVSTASVRSCESDECSSEQSSGESEDNEEMTISTIEVNLTTTATKMPRTQTSILSETSQATRPTSLEPSSIRELSRETTMASTSETLNVQKEECTESSCSEEYTNRGSVETSRRRTLNYSDESGSNCDSLIEACDNEDDVSEDTSERLGNRTVECSRILCEEKLSSESSSECNDMLQNEGDDQRCVKTCASREEIPREGQGDSVGTEKSTELKYKGARNHRVCEIQDPHYRHQMKRLAKMRAISSGVMSRDNVFESRTTPQRRDRIATKKLRKLLGTKLPRFEDKRSRLTVNYLHSGAASVKYNERSGKQRDEGANEKTQRENQVPGNRRIA